MAELQIGGEFDALGGTDIGISHEDHIRNRSSGEDNATDKLAYQVETAMLVCDGHNDADGDEEDAGNTQGQEQPIPWQMDRVAIYVVSIAQLVKVRLIGRPRELTAPLCKLQ